MMLKNARFINKKLLYAAAGFAMGFGAPVIWAVINLIFFPNPRLSLGAQIIDNIFQSPYSIALYGYMWIGTTIVMSTFGYFIGNISNLQLERAQELDSLHCEVLSQKDIFENRYNVLDENIKKFHQISNRIQKSLDVDEVLSLCAEGLHEVLGYERVNILMADTNRTSLYFAVVTGSEDFDPGSVTLPLDTRIGVIYKCFSERRRFLIDDIAKCPSDYYLQPPYDSIKPLRSRSCVLCPIVVKGETIGLFGIDNKISQRLSNESDVDTINLFADQAASAITRINLLKAIDTLTSELETTFSTFLQKRDTYSRIVNNLKAAVNSIFNGTEKIASASEGVMSSVDETSSAVSEISVAIDQVSKNLDYLSESIENSVSAMEQMHVSIKNVETNAAVSHEVSSQVKQQADKSRSEVEQTIDALADIQKSVELTYETIKKLTENSGRIGNIVNVIKEITKRTNLLALNASIIAAQAGENGKNFGVVADEIRNLSQQTGSSTGEIAGIIEEILTESQQASRNVSFSKELVHKGVNLGRTLGESLGAIVQRADRSMEMTEEIKIATEEQVRGVNLITRSIEDVSTMTAQIFNASKEQSNATKNIVKYVHSIKDMTEGMVKAAAVQVQDGADIEKSVVTHVCMVEEIFDVMERRKDESLAVIRELEIIKETS
jgi:methyl-accepting chemotaxis protein